MSKHRKATVEQCAAMFKALSNPKRLSIFLRLLSCCSPGTRWKTEDGAARCVGDLGRDLGIVASTVSHHIKELHQAGLIRMERRGQSIECWIDPDAVRELRQFLDGAPDGRLCRGPAGGVE